MSTVYDPKVTTVTINGRPFSVGIVSHSYSHSVEEHRAAINEHRPNLRSELRWVDLTGPEKRELILRMLERPNGWRIVLLSTGRTYLTRGRTNRPRL